MLTALIFLVILSVLVLIHELGHFFVAKKLGIKVEEFGFGLPPRLFCKKIGETRYSLNWLPIGGFVKLYGEDEAPLRSGSPRGQHSRSRNFAQEGQAGAGSKIKNIKRAFFARPVGQRAAVVIAGVAMNVILAVIIFYAFLFISNFKTQIPLLGDYKFLFVDQKNSTDIIVSSVAKDSPVEKAGMKPFSRIVSINNQKVTDIKYFLDIVNRNKGKEIVLSWQDVRINKTYKTIVVPRVSPPKNQGALGVGFFSMSSAVLEYKTQYQKLLSGFVHPVNLMVYNFDVMGKLIKISFKEKTIAPLSEGVSGPVGIYSLVGSIVQIPDLKERILQVLNLAGILSISLAFFNILPIPALDGGRLFFILIEAVVGKKISPKIEGYAHAIGMAILLTLILLITFQDIVKIFR